MQVCAIKLCSLLVILSPVAPFCTINEGMRSPRSTRSCQHHENCFMERKRAALDTIIQGLKYKSTSEGPQGAECPGRGH